MHTTLRCVGGEGVEAEVVKGRGWVHSLWPDVLRACVYRYGETGY